MPKVINAILALPITIVCALLGTLIFVMGVAAVFDEGEPIGVVFIIWYIAGILGIVGLWKLGLRFQWREIEIRDSEWFLLLSGFLACAPFPFFVRWKPNEPYGFIVIYSALFMALILTLSVIWFGIFKRTNKAEQNV